jgi:hypothetical protein
MFPDWSEVDVLFALQETNGDENEAVTRIAEGISSSFLVQHHLTYTCRRYCIPMGRSLQGQEAIEAQGQGYTRVDR